MASLALAAPSPRLPVDAWRLVAARLPSPLDQAVLAGVCSDAHAAVAELRLEQHRAARAELRAVLLLAARAPGPDHMRSKALPGFTWTTSGCSLAWAPLVALQRGWPSHQWLSGSYVIGRQVYSHGNPALGVRGLGGNACVACRLSAPAWHGQPLVTRYMAEHQTSFEDALSLVAAARLLARLSRLPAELLLADEGTCPTDTLPNL